MLMTVAIILSLKLHALAVTKMLAIEIYELTPLVLFIFSKLPLVPISVFHAQEFFHTISIMLEEQLFLLNVSHALLHFC
jgi:hypothetical protein